MRASIRERLKKLDVEMKRLEDEKQNLLIQRDIVETLTPTKQLAILLHDSFCSANHIDSCGWEYETHQDWEKAHAHKHWLERAQALEHNLFDIYKL